MAHDLIVVGGGPAGSTCARRSAQLGLDVLLIEKATHPRRKACGGGLTLRVKDGLDFDFSSVIEREECGLRLVSPSGIVVEEIRSETTGYTVRREDFDHLLFKKAEEAGAQVIQGSNVIDIAEDSTGVDVFTSGDNYRGRLLIGADGVNSTIGRRTGIHTGWKDDEVALCMEASVPMDESKINELSGGPDNDGRILIEILFGAMPHGYAWIFAKRKEYSLGLGALVSELTDLKGKWKEFTSEFEKRAGVKLDMSDTTALRVPLCGMIENTCSKKVMLIGDAAGFVSPVTGEGIHYAIESARVAADVAHKIVSGKVDVNTMTYHNEMKNTIGKDLGIAKFLANIMFHSLKNMESVVKMAHDDEIMKKYTLDLIMGMYSNKEMRSKMMKRMLTKHPLKAIRMII